jgi:hypothetical protein
MIYHPYQRMDGGASLPQDVKDELFKSVNISNSKSDLAKSYRLLIRLNWLFRISSMREQSTIGCSKPVSPIS